MILLLPEMRLPARMLDVEIGIYAYPVVFGVLGSYAGIKMFDIFLYQYPARSGSLPLPEGS